MNTVVEHISSKQPGVSQFHQPGSMFFSRDRFGISFWPAEGNCFDVWLRKRQGGVDTKYIEERSCSVLKFDKSSGDYVLRFRWRPKNRQLAQWTDWSSAHKFTIIEETDINLERINKHRIVEHQIEVMISRLSNGVVSLHNPWLAPPNHPGKDAKWFPTACYEGSTQLINQTREYYLDPMKYFLDSIRLLKEKNAIFLTWAKILRGEYDADDFNCILQFDLDAGVQSFFQIASELEKFGAIGSLMVHRSCHDWYEWKIEDLGIDRFQALEKLGWEIGYHNNTLTSEQRLNKIGDYSSEILVQAANRFSNDIYFLRQHLTIDVFTHHGGNTFNRYVKPDPGLNLTCVDRRFAKDLWTGIKGKFSDGGFLVRPLPLKEHIEALGDGLHFFRLHPVKYGNYEGQADLAPLPVYQKVSANLIEHETREGNDTSLNELQKQAVWFSLRDKGRKGYPLSHASLEKPISSEFRNSAEIKVAIEKYRSQRRDNFLRMYPWAFGDPRVFWWQMLSSFTPNGKILNVGAMPPGQKSETLAFLSPDSDVLEMDIDPKRAPDIIGDFSEPNEEFNDSFDAVLLFSLPYFYQPQKAVDNCHKFLKTGGRALLGFCADTHPERGGLWRPDDRPVWRPDKQISPPLTLKTNLWSFDQESVAILLKNWPGTIRVEFFYNYWFVIGDIVK